MDLSAEEQAKNQLASDWMHCGMDLLEQTSTTSWERSRRCFDEAVALRQSLPWRHDPFLRYGLSAGWIHSGDALVKSNELSAALKSYAEALALLQTLPLEENVLYARRLAILWINQGIALQKRSLGEDLFQAATSFRSALEVLEKPWAQAMMDHQLLQAGAWINLSGVLLQFGKYSWAEAHRCAQRGLLLVEKKEETEFSFAKMGLRARHLLARWAMLKLSSTLDLFDSEKQEALNAVDDALVLAKKWNFSDEEDFERLTRDLFIFGCRLYENRQPHFLAEFILETLDSQKNKGDNETYQAAQAALWQAFAGLQKKGVSGLDAVACQRLLSEVQELKKVEQRLKAWPLSPATSNH